MSSWYLIGRTGLTWLYYLPLVCKIPVWCAVQHILAPLHCSVGERVGRKEKRVGKKKSMNSLFGK